MDALCWSFLEACEGAETVAACEGFNVAKGEEERGGGGGGGGSS